MPLGLAIASYLYSEVSGLNLGHNTIYFDQGLWWFLVTLGKYQHSTLK